MTQREYQKRRRRIAEGCCPRCGRAVSPWPLQRPDVCSPGGAVVCWRHWPDIVAAEQRLLVTAH